MSIGFEPSNMYFIIHLLFADTEIGVYIDCHRRFGYDRIERVQLKLHNPVGRSFYDAQNWKLTASSTQGPDCWIGLRCADAQEFMTELKFSNFELRWQWQRQRRRRRRKLQQQEMTVENVSQWVYAAACSPLTVSTLFSALIESNREIQCAFVGLVFFILVFSCLCFCWASIWLNLFIDVESPPPPSRGGALSLSKCNRKQNYNFLSTSRSPPPSSRSLAVWYLAYNK